MTWTTGIICQFAISRDILLSREHVLRGASPRNHSKIKRVSVLSEGWMLLERLWFIASEKYHIQEFLSCVILNCRDDSTLEIITKSSAVQRPWAVWSQKSWAKNSRGVNIKWMSRCNLTSVQVVNWNALIPANHISLTYMASEACQAHPKPETVLNDRGVCYRPGGNANQDHWRSLLLPFLITALAGLTRRSQRDLCLLQQRWSLSKDVIKALCCRWTKSRKTWWSVVLLQEKMQELLEDWGGDLLFFAESSKPTYQDQ
jgi:hypothetical protein